PSRQVPPVQSAGVVQAASGSPAQCGKSTISSPQRGSVQSTRQWFGAPPFASPWSHSSPESTKPLPHATHPPTHGAAAPQAALTVHAAATLPAQWGPVTIAAQSAVQASVPPSG